MAECTMYGGIMVYLISALVAKLVYSVCQYHCALACNYVSGLGRVHSRWSSSYLMWRAQS